MAVAFGGRCLYVGTVFALGVSLVASGCGKPTDNPAPDADPVAVKANSAPLKKSAPWIKADPNPAPIPAGAEQGTTTVSWDTGDGSNSKVYLRVANKPDQLFSGGPRNKQEAKWIRKNATYEFVLLGGPEFKTELARVTVVGESTGGKE
jgi:hypothetical protein